MCDVNKIDPLGGFTEEELNAYTAQRYKIYSGTIAVCVIYSVIAFILILLGYFTAWGREFLLNTILPFVVTYIIGTIIIIIVLAKQVSDYKPVKIDNRIGYDNDICPDYWKLVVSDPTEYKDDDGVVYLSSNVNPNLFKYKCVMDPNVMKIDDIKKADDSLGTKIYNYDKVNTNNIIVDLNNSSTKELSGLNKELLMPKLDEFKKYGAYMSGFEIGLGDKLVSLSDTPITSKKIEQNGVLSDTNITNLGLNNGDVAPLVCDKVYPLYLAAMDNNNAQLNPNEPKNRYRSAYSKSCGVPWTEAGVI